MSLSLWFCKGDTNLKWKIDMKIEIIIFWILKDQKKKILLNE